MKPVFPNFYLITPDFLGNIKEYLQSLEASLINGVGIVQLRSKHLTIEEYKNLAKHVVALVHSYQAKIILNSSVSLLDDINADGIHYPSAKLAEEICRPLSDKYIVSTSCHNQEQINLACRFKVDMAVLSPIFSTPSSPAGIPLGWGKFSQLVQTANFPIYALGGLQISDYQQARTSGAYGISAKRALWNLKKPIASEINY